MIRGAVQLGEPRRITIATRLGEEIEIAVTDTGPGIPPDVLPQIFEPLFSTRSFGAGLGLAIVSQIVAQHGGTVAAESTLGQGTTVRLRLPRAITKTIAA